MLKTILNGRLVKALVEFAFEYNQRLEIISVPHPDREAPAHLINQIFKLAVSHTSVRSCDFKKAHMELGMTFGGVATVVKIPYDSVESLRIPELEIHFNLMAPGDGSIAQLMDEIMRRAEGAKPKESPDVTEPKFEMIKSKSDDVQEEVTGPKILKRKPGSHVDRDKFKVIKKK